MAEKYVLLVIMVPVGAILQFIYMTWRLNGEWQKMTKTKQLGSVLMGSVASVLTVLALADVERLTIDHKAFVAGVAGLSGGEVVQMVVQVFKYTVRNRLRGNNGN